jgi:hypothetical protein
MRWFGKLLMYGGAVVLALAVPMVCQFSASAQEDEDEAADDEGRDERVRQLQDELERLQAELAKEGVAPRTFTPPQGAFGGAQQYLERMDAQIAEQEEQIAALIEEHGEDSDEVAKARQQLAQLQRQARLMRGQRPSAEDMPEGAIFPGDDADARSRMIEQMKRMMGERAMRPDMSGAPGGMGMMGMGSLPEGMGQMGPGDMGHRLIVQGMEAQLQGIADLIASSDDEETIDELNDSFDEVAERMIEALADYRQAEIERLEKRLEELRQATDEESIESIRARFLGGSETGDEAGGADGADDTDAEAPADEGAAKRKSAKDAE